MGKTRKRSDKELQATAYHEAGHAVITIAQGLTIDTVSIIPGGYFNGRCIQPTVYGYDRSNKREDRSIARALIISTYAGMHAQRLVDPDAPSFHGDKDESDAFDLSREHGVFPRYMDFVGDECHRAYLDKLRLEARRLVNRYCKSIEKLAELLLQRKTLERPEVEQLIESLLDR
jgi:ATP-dependent Zn protease